MKKLSVAILGFGTVGQGVRDVIYHHQERLKNIVGVPVEISTILIKNPEIHQNNSDHIRFTTDFKTILSDPTIDIVFEAIVGKEPAFSYLKQCIEANKHVITANKEMFQEHGQKLKKLAAEYNVGIGFDATTAGGIPIIQTIQQLLHVNKITKVQAILNGTSNYVLTKMREKGSTFDDALQKAQSLGYAEADPTNDIEGYDAFYKLKILSELLFDEQPVWENVKRIGISRVSKQTIEKEAASGKRIKHIAEIALFDGTIAASIEPRAIPTNHPLYAIEGVNNAIYMETDILGNLTLTGPGAGAYPTASAMVEDLCHIMKQPYEIRNKDSVIAFS
ncbi:homoserine dehydrogenase [Virgibacillus ndiopensis]|uniref:homoserine dehydrogenase n=1 Tax=Virgibacillus ndiopensis TaxID=2004408 RepID=UPI000C070F88|nr:homoserine dehydrogenase [Virgibacillus ndiopensis]